LADFSAYLKSTERYWYCVANKLSAGASKTWLEVKKWFKVYFFAYNYNQFLLHEMKTLTLEIDEIFKNS